MMKRLMTGLMAVGLVMCGFAMAQAEEQASPGKPVQVKFDSETGCWPAYGWQASTGVNFDIKVTKPGTFLFVQMVTPAGIDDGGGQMAGRDVTISQMDRGQWLANVDMELYDRSQSSMIGKAMVPGSYQIGFSPTASWGTLALVRVCHSMENSFPAMPFKLPQSQ